LIALGVTLLALVVMSVADTYSDSGWHLVLYPLLLLQLLLLAGQRLRHRARRVRFRLLFSYGLVGLLPPILVSFLCMVALYFLLAGVQMVAIRRAATERVESVAEWVRVSVPESRGALPPSLPHACRWLNGHLAFGTVGVAFAPASPGQDAALELYLPYPDDAILVVGIPLESDLFPAIERATGRRVSLLTLRRVTTESAAATPNLGLFLEDDLLTIRWLQGNQVRAEAGFRWRQVPIVSVSALRTLFPAAPDNLYLLAEDTFVSFVARLAAEQGIPIALICWVLGAVFLLAEALLLGIVMWVGDRVGRDTDRLEAAARRVAAGDFSVRVPARAQDQLGDLARSFNEMVQDLDLLLKQRTEAERVEGEIAACTTIQEGLLPPADARVAGLSIAAFSRPARNVGGDLYDYFELPGGRVALLVADVAGKGVSAALYMAELKGLVIAYADGERTPAEVARALHRALCRTLRAGAFITLAYVEIDPRSGHGQVIRAGHPAPMIAGPRSVHEVEADGVALGLSLIRDPVVRVGRFALREDECLLLFTDGLTEAIDAAGVEMADGSLLETTARAARETPGDPAALREQLLAALQSYPGRADDVTILIAARARATAPQAASGRVRSEPEVLPTAGVGES
jgi:serine phosphatase RsbU (regulator of sigma subunit)